MFPDTAGELDEAVQVFALLSSQGEIKGCVTCLDDIYCRYKYLQAERLEMSRHIFQVIIRHMESMYRLYIITKVGLFMLSFMHQEEQMTVQH